MSAILSKNLFDILGDENDQPVEVVAPKTIDPPAQIQPSKTPRAPKNEYPRRGGRASRPVTGEKQVLKDRNNRAPKSDNTPFENPPQHNEGKLNHAPQRHGARGGRVGRGRDFDRRSGTGTQKGGEKKEVAGKGSWGNAIETETSALVEEPVAEPVAEPKTPAEDSDVVPEEEKEPEEELKTLEQFFMEQQSKKAAALEMNTRKANEGADETQWKDTTLLKKSDQEEAFFSGSKSASNKVKKNKEKPQKTYLEIDQTFTASRGNARGRGRGGRGRGDFGSRNNRGGHGEKLNVADTSAFPSLGAN